MIDVPVTPGNQQLADLLKTAAEGDVVLVQDGLPVGVVIALTDDDDRFDFALEDDPRFASRIASARREAADGKTRKWEPSGE